MLLLILIRPLTLILLLILTRAGPLALELALLGRHHTRIIKGLLPQLLSLGLDLIGDRGESTAGERLFTITLNQSGFHPD